MKIIKPSVTVLSHTHDPELVIERAGRVCYRSEDNIGPGSAGRFIRMLKSKGHLSVLEHASASLLLVTDRAIANELVRHRIGASYSQRSTRYVRATDAEFVKPTRIPEDSAAYHYWVNACIAAESNYQNLLDSGCTPEDARSVLPLCTATEIAVTMTFRAWMHFLDLRLDAKAHPDMRVLAHLIQNELIQICPAVFGE